MRDETTKIEFHTRSKLPIRNRQRIGRATREGSGGKSKGVGNVYEGVWCGSRRGEGVRNVQQ